MSFKRRILSVLAGSLVLTAGLLDLAGQEAGSGPGLALGEKAPAFELKDADGAARRLEDLKGATHLALVFHRSADW